jgi:hypothetical protein
VSASGSLIYQHVFSRPQGLASVDEDFELGGDAVKIDRAGGHHQIRLPQQAEYFR